MARRRPLEQRIRELQDRLDRLQLQKQIQELRNRVPRRRRITRRT